MVASVGGVAKEDGEVNQISLVFSNAEAEFRGFSSAGNAGVDDWVVS